MTFPSVLFFALGLAFLPPAVAAEDLEDTLKDRVEARHDLAKDAAREDYVRAQETCRKLTGEAKDACIEASRAEYSSAKQRADSNEEAGKSEAELVGDQLKARYKAQRARCDQLSGASRDLCINDAKILYRQ